MDTRSMERNVICVKWGDKFSAKYVNRLYRMAQKNISVPFSFYCLTEDSTDILPEVNIIPLDLSLGLHTWFWKISLFKDNLVSGDVNLFFDLDVVIQNNIDSLFDIDQLTLIDFSKRDVDSVIPINSSIVAWRNNTMNHIYDKFVDNKQFYMSAYHGLDWFLLYDVGEFEGWGDHVYYSRTKGNYEDEPNDGKVPLEQGSIGVHYYPQKLVCIFNQAHEDKFYRGFDKYF